MTLGLKRGTVALVPHETAWEVEAARTIEKLKGILGNAAVDMRHVGSTAIPAICAKPIVDIAVAVRSFADINEKQAELEAQGFYRRSWNDEGQELFACGSHYDGTGDRQTHFIHMVLADSAEWRNYLNFRDYLNAFPKEAKAYEALKLSLAAANPEDAGREKYTSGKHDFIRQTLRKALVWSLLGKTMHVIVDRPVGYRHVTGGSTITYPLNHGYLPGILSGDGETLDVYLLGVSEPVQEAEARIIGIVHRKNDAEDKLIGATDGRSYTREEMSTAVQFQEQFFDTVIQTTEDDDREWTELG